jgi:hypothetical protein
MDEHGCAEGSIATSRRQKKQAKIDEQSFIDLQAI